jgi:bifunctional non-homologous end joining protein LigD
MLEEYYRKRNFGRTPEPKRDTKQTKQIRGNKGRDSFCKNMMQQDYIMILDLRTKKRVLKSWAVPKGISLDPKIKRLAVLTEDHPVDYLLFEGVIPAGSYGAGTVIVWDTGTYTTEEEISNQMKDYYFIVWSEIKRKV